MVSVVFALLTALANGSASVCQRLAARDAPASKALHLSLFGYLIRRRIWLAGIGLTILAAACQAAALATGPVALVQPILIIELPFKLLLASRLVHPPLPPLNWGAVILVTASHGARQAAAPPTRGRSVPCASPASPTPRASLRRSGSGPTRGGERFPGPPTRSWRCPPGLEGKARHGRETPKSPCMIMIIFSWATLTRHPAWMALPGWVPSHWPSSSVTPTSRRRDR